MPCLKTAAYVAVKPLCNSATQFKFFFFFYYTSPSKVFPCGRRDGLFGKRKLPLFLLSGLVGHVLCVDPSMALSKRGLVNLISLIKSRLGMLLWHLNIYIVYL